MTNTKSTGAIPPDILYHYCSTESFLSIVSHGSIRLSALSLSNDSSEGRLLQKRLKHLAERDELRPDYAAALFEVLEEMERIVDGLAFCLSREKDLLSQWRGYADDGRGVAIGFRSSCLQQVQAVDEHGKSVGAPPKLVEVEYVPEIQLALIEPHFKTTTEFMVQRERAVREKGQQISEVQLMSILKSGLRHELGSVVPLLHRLKSSAFSEEREWRLLSVFSSGDLKCQFRARSSSLIPYRDYMLSSGAAPAIAEVWLGPKHTTPISVVEQMLRKFRFEKVRVERSGASYR